MTAADDAPAALLRATIETVGTMLPFRHSYGPEDISLAVLAVVLPAVAEHLRGCYRALPDPYCDRAAAAVLDLLPEETP